ncbi:MAG: hypothetical protein KDB86_07970, partial [Actinobacteria bacterium]|nr:hypothetical protein [Actinomycetota bacterium]
GAAGTAGAASSTAAVGGSDAGPAAERRGPVDRVGDSDGGIGETQRIVLSEDPNHPLLLAALVASVLAIALALFALQQVKANDDGDASVGTTADAAQVDDRAAYASPAVALADVRTFVDERQDAEARDVWLCETHLRLINTTDQSEEIESVQVVLDSGGRQRTLDIQEGLVEDKVAPGTDHYGWIQAATLTPTEGFGIEEAHELSSGGLKTAYLSDVAPLPLSVGADAITDIIVRVDSNSAWHVPDLEALDAAVSKPTEVEGIPLSYLAVVKFSDGSSLTMPTQSCGNIAPEEVAALEAVLPSADE